GHGIKVNDVTVTDPNAVLGTKDIKDGVIKVSLGKKRHVLLKPEE
ncbi:MAG TPA: tyrosine--tRNA ligase, partial [Methylovirgula sp.]